MKTKRWLLKALMTLFLFSGVTLSASNWEPPLVVSNGIGISPSVTIVCDSNDNAAVVWDQGGEIYSSYRPFTGLWEAPTNHGKGNFPQICMDEAGNLTLIFAVSTVQDSISAAFRPFGGTWTSAATIFTAAAGPNTLSGLSLSCTSTNFYGMAAWINTSGGAASTVVQTLIRTVTGTGWHPVSDVKDVNTPGTDDADTSSNPIVHILPTGNATVVTRLNNVIASAIDIRYSTTTAPGSVWPAPTGLGFTGGVFGINPTLFDFDMKSNGNAVVAVEAGNNSIGATTATIPGAWTAAAVITATISKSPKAGVDSNGLATVAWQTDAPAVIQMATANVTTPVWAITSLTPIAGSSVSTPLVDVSTNGNVIVGWSSGAGNFAALIGANGTLELTTAIIDSDTAPQSVCVSTTQRGFAAWLSTDTGFVTASRTFEPIDAVGNLLKALGKKRLIYQKGLYP